MALPTVEYARIVAGTNASLISAFMPIFQGLMFDAGWDILYADATAIGGGSSSVPAWDATPTINTSAGRAIYRMPANDHSRQWYVQIELGWGGNAANNHRFIVTIGTGWDSVDTLTGAGNTVTYESGGATTGLEVLMAASDDGLAFEYVSTNATTTRFVLVERARDLDGTVGDDLILLGYSSNGTFPDGNPSYSGMRYRGSDGLEYAVNRWFLLAPTTSPSSFPNNSTSSTTSADGETNLPIGPICMSGTPAGLPRLVQIVGQLDAVAGTDHPVLIDGGVKQYRTPNSFITSAYVVLVARE